jgi:alkylated DNA repair dioxygenase AlkB
MKAPAIYVPDFVRDPDHVFVRLRDELEWEHRDAPRYEYYCNDHPKPYVYGVGKGQREYLPRPYHEEILILRQAIQMYATAEFGLSPVVLDVCFLNRYLHGRHHLGWHADDSPEMDDKRPIAVVSLGSEREIWFRPILGTRCSCCGEMEHDIHKMSCYVRDSRKTVYGEVEKLKLGHGSLLLMAPGMQDTHQHRIPKSDDAKCGERISLTYRGYVEVP